MIGVIGGSGLYKFIENAIVKKIDTPFGEVNVDIGKINGEEVVFIPRHGNRHSIPPSQINYRANIYAAHTLGVKKIYATNAVGSLNYDNKPGTLAVPDQIFDYTSCRKDTFFDGSDFKVVTNKGEELSGVVHTDMSTPFDTDIRNEIIDVCREFGENVVDGGTIVVVNGPRYETPAEIEAFKRLGCSYAGMTSSPEAFLAKELQIPYATIAVITNFAAGMQSNVSHSEVEILFKQKIDMIFKILNKLIKNSI